MSRKKKNNTRLVLIIILTVLLIILISGVVYAYNKINNTLNHDKVYDFVYVNDQLVSGMTKGELRSFLVENYQEKYETITFDVVAKDKTFSSSLEDLEVKFDVDKTVENIYSLGREDSVLKSLAVVNNLKENPKQISFSYTYNEDKIKEFVDMVYMNTYIEKQLSEYKIDFDNMAVNFKSGHHGEKIDKDILYDEIKNIADNALTNKVIELNIIKDPINTIDGSEIYNKIYIPSRDASGDVVNKELLVNDHKVGRTVDKEKLKETVDYINSNEDSTATLSIETLYPEITTEIYKSNIFTSELASYSTEFDTYTENQKARAHNIGLATDKIDGTILIPGQEFSFNSVVGPRSEATGYKIAHVYVSGEIVDGIGGGICQVSTTLYNMALLSDMEISVRRNHMFTVSYAPLSQDATVSYGTQDFRFVNNTNWPVRVNGYVSDDDKVHFSITGTDENPNTSIEIRSKTIEKIPFEIEYVEDTSLSPGQEIVKDYGKDGYVSEAFKIYYENGNKIKEESLGRDYYSPYNQIVRKGPGGEND